MKVAFIVSRFPIRSETFILRQALGLLKSGVDLEIISFAPGDPWMDDATERLFAKRVRVFARQPRIAFWSSAAQLVCKSLISKIHRRAAHAAIVAFTHGQRVVVRTIVSLPRGLGRYDGILAHFGPIGVHAAYLKQAGFLSGPLATAFHGYDMSMCSVLKKQRRGYMKLFSEGQLMLPISYFWADRLKKWNCPPQKVRVLRMGVDIDPTVVPDFSRPVGRPLRVISVGRFTEKKGICYAIRGVQEAGRPIIFSIIGFGELEAELRQAAAATSCADIVFLGSQPHDAVLDLVAGADVFLLPSVTASSGDMEGIPVALMEAMIRGVVVISTRHSGIPELVNDNYSGLLVDERSSEQIASALQMVQSGAVDVKSMRQAAYDHVSTHFNNSILDRELLKVFHDMSLTNGAVR